MRDLFNYSQEVSADTCEASLEKYGVLPSKLLIQYVQLVMNINTIHNITGATTSDEFVKKHIADTWQAWKILGVPHFSLGTQLVDVGSGGGLPGIPLAIFSPGTKVTLVERRVKKAKILSHMVSVLGLENQVSVLGQSFEQSNLFGEGIEYWIRGFLPGMKLGQYLSDNFPRANLGTIILMKGPQWSSEKQDIVSNEKIKFAWRERIASSEEMSYNLPDNEGKRVLVLV